MNKFKRWFRINVLKKETLLFKVYWRYESPDLKKSHVFCIETYAKSKAEARDFFKLGVTYQIGRAHV